MAKQKVIWSYNGVRVTRRWLEFNYGKAWVNECTIQAEAFFRVNPSMAYDFGNGVAAVSAGSVH